MSTMVDEQMYEIYDQLAARALLALESLEAPAQLWIAIAGPPGAGKSTLSHAVQQTYQYASRFASVVDNSRDNPTRSNAQVPCVAIPMDGYHYYKHELDAMDDPVAARRRRGAYWTFNAEKLIADIQQAKDAHQGSFPSFDHGVGDPVEGDIHLLPEHRVVLVEGNYLLLYNQQPWDQLQALFDIRWFISCSVEQVRQRVVSRHMQVGSTEADAVFRLEDNDLPNALTILETQTYADLVIESR